MDPRANAFVPGAYQHNLRAEERKPAETAPSRLANRNSCTEPWQPMRPEEHMQLFSTRLGRHNPNYLESVGHLANSGQQGPGRWNNHEDKPIAAMVIIPTDEVIFFKGVGIPPTRSYRITGSGRKWVASAWSLHVSACLCMSLHVSACLCMSLEQPNNYLQKWLTSLTRRGQNLWHTICWWDEHHFFTVIGVHEKHHLFGAQLTLPSIGPEQVQQFAKMGVFPSQKISFQFQY